MKKFLLAVAILSSATSVFAQTAFTGTYTWGANGNTNSFAYNGTDIANLTESAFTKVGVTTGSSSGNFRASGWALDPVIGSLTGTNDPSKYFEFSLTADSGFTLSMTNINFGVGRSGTGPRTFVWSSSVDSFATIITNYTVPANVTNNAGVITIGDVTSTTLTNIVLDLSAASFQSLTAVTFRFYAYNSEGAGGTAGLQGPLTFSGSLNAPVGTTYVWSGGSGNWGNGQQGNFDAPFADSGIAIAQFGTTGGTVTVDAGGVETGQMQFDVTGFEIAGGTVTNGLGSVTVADASVATISSDLAGTSGLNKLGNGTLVLSGSKSYSGAVTVAAGTLEIAEDGALGNAANDLAIGGTLRTTASISLGAGRDLSGTGTLDIANGTTLTVNGAAAMSSTMLANTGTLAFANAASDPGNITTSYGAGTAVISGNVNFSAGDKVINVASGGTLEMSGALNLPTAGGTELTKEGEGVLNLTGTGSSISRVQIGRTGATPTVGGILRVGDASNLGAQEIYFNTGTLELTSDVTTANGISLGGRTDGVATIGGAGGNGALVVEGAGRFFRGTGTSGELVLDVNNVTTFSGGFVATSGGGTATGITIGGAGEVVISGAASALTDTITLTDTVKLTLNNTIGGALNVGASNVLGGNGAILGSLSLTSGAKFVFSLTDTLTVDGATVSFGGFGIDDLIGLDNTVANGAYTIIDGLATVDTANLSNLGVENAFDLGEGKSAYFSTGSLVVNVVPEPSTYALLSLAAAGLGAHIVRRRRR